MDREACANYKEEEWHLSTEIMKLVYKERFRDIHRMRLEKEVELNMWRGYLNLRKNEEDDEDGKP